MMRTMSFTDRISWIVWSWGLCLVSLRSTRSNRYKLRVRIRKGPDRKQIPVEAAA